MDLESPRLRRAEQWACIVATELINSDSLCGQGLDDKQLAKIADDLIMAVVKHIDSPLLRPGDEP